MAIALILVACGQSDNAHTPQSNSQELVVTQIADSASQPAAQSVTDAISPTAMPRVVDTEDVSHIPLQPVATVLSARATQTPPLRGFADAVLPSRTPFPPPAGTCSGGCDAPLQGCLIKGTLPRADYKVFLLPGQPGYAAAQIDTQKGERWFCTVAEARAAGWMPSKVPLPAQAPAP